MLSAHGLRTGSGARRGQGGRRRHRRTARCGARARLGDRRATTSDDGGFVLGNVPPGRVELRVRRIGYAPWRDVVDVMPGLDRSVSVGLAPLPAAARQPDRRRRARRDLDLRRRARGAGAVISARALDGWEGVVVRRTGSGGTGLAPAAWWRTRRGAGARRRVSRSTIRFTGRADLSAAVQSRGGSASRSCPERRPCAPETARSAGVIVVRPARAIRPEGSAWTGRPRGKGIPRRRRRWAARRPALERSGYADRLSRTPFPRFAAAERARGRNSGGDAYAGSATLEGPDRDGRSAARGPTADFPARPPIPRPPRAGTPGSLGAPRRARRGAVAVERLAAVARDACGSEAPPTGLRLRQLTRTASGGRWRRATGCRDRAGGWSGATRLAVEGRGDRFAGDGVRAGASFTQAALRWDGRFAPRRGHRRGRWRRRRGSTSGPGQRSPRRERADRRRVGSEGVPASRWPSAAP